jgi:D-alanyl-lipoteichoic acid acyltransferase DltB (MBOAT superfamily)
MELIHILLFAALALPYAILPARARRWALFLLSALALYGLQPTLDIRWLDYSLPTLTVIVAVICWWVTRAARVFSREDAAAILALVAVALVLTLPRYIALPSALLLTSRPPPIEMVAIGLTLALVVSIMAGRLPVRITLMIVVIVGMLIVLKTEALAIGLAGILRGQVGQDAALAKASDIGWLGFSYIAFRLIHTLRDRQMGILPALTLREYVTYVIFFPALASGPIDRAERFVSDVRAVSPTGGVNAEQFVCGGQRILSGMVKKFVIADTLALFTLDAVTAEQATSAGALWLLLYGYAFRLFFDFSGYTDIAIGIGMLFGVNLPENFDRPYAKNNITAFWNSWHITLSAWVRSYVYSPLSRHLIKGKRLSNASIILISNGVTMSIIGLWHGVTWTFLVWGVWHALGLWVHRLWSDRTRVWYRELKTHPARLRVWHGFGVLLTFHFVLLGWVWFALPDVDMALTTFARLFGWHGA